MRREQRGLRGSRPLSETTRRSEPICWTRQMIADRVALVGWTWRTILRPLFFRLEAENAHDRTMGWFSWLLRFPGCRWLTTAFFRVSDPRLRVCRFGLDFPNPVGLAAGMDKNARWCDSLQTLGFGFIEVGTLTALAQNGKDRPRV